jgi:hypothetical protein
MVNPQFQARKLRCWLRHACFVRESIRPVGRDHAFALEQDRAYLLERVNVAKGISLDSDKITFLAGFESSELFQA